MNYVIDVKTGEIIAELVGDTQSIANRFLDERRRQGLDVSISSRSSGYVLMQRRSDGRIEPIIEVRKTAPVNVKRVIVKYLILSVLFVLSLTLTLAFKLMAAGLNQRFDDIIDLSDTRLARRLLSLV